MPDLTSLDALIAQHGLASHAAAIKALVRPCVRLARTPVAQHELGPLDSRLGGDPHLPDSLEWPFWRGMPLAHLATIRLSEASAHDRAGLLPRSGLLYFWYDLVEQPWGYDPETAGFFRVDFVADENTTLRLRTIPEDRIPSDAYRGFLDDSPHSPCRVRFEAGLTLPSGEWIDAYAPEAAALGDLDAYHELVHRLPGDQPHHWLLGHPAAVQGPMELECQLVSHGVSCGEAIEDDDPRVRALRPGAAEWQLLFQIDTDEEGPGWMWGDVGRLYFWIPREALRRAAFDRAWMILQCY